MRAAMHARRAGRRRLATFAAVFGVKMASRAMGFEGVEGDPVSCADDRAVGGIAAGCGARPDQPRPGQDGGPNFRQSIARIATRKPTRLWQRQECFDADGVPAASITRPAVTRRPRLPPTFWAAGSERGKPAQRSHEHRYRTAQAPRASNPSPRTGRRKRQSRTEASRQSPRNSGRRREAEPKREARRGERHPLPRRSRGQAARAGPATPCEPS